MTAQRRGLAGDVLGSEVETWAFCLYVAGVSRKARTALENLRRLCDEHLPGRWTLEIIDVSENPEAARHDQIVAIPTLVKKLPPPVAKVIGDLSNSERVLVGLDLKP